MPSVCGPPKKPWSRSCARRPEGKGLISETDLAVSLGFVPQGIASALAALQGEGFALRGRFSPNSDGDEWCERRLLARIHHYTVKRLRAEIEPVAARDFMRFLFSWQRVALDTRMEGPDAVDVVAAQLEGFEAPAAAWEAEILPTRIKGYEPYWLDDRCLAGQYLGALAAAGVRQAAARGGGARAHHLDHSACAQNAALGIAQTDGVEPSAAARVADYIRQHGGSSTSLSPAPAGALREALPARRAGSSASTASPARAARAVERRAQAARQRAAPPLPAKFGWPKPDAGRCTRAPACREQDEATEHVART
jgi:ATP-dependent Lhr-like helicase